MKLSRAVGLREDKTEGCLGGLGRRYTSFDSLSSQCHLSLKTWRKSLSDHSDPQKSLYPTWDTMAWMVYKSG